jgi:anti-sigma factor RsiW
MADSKPLTDDDRAELVAYLDGELPADAQRRVEARLNADAAARTEADTLRRAWDLLDYLPRAEPSTDFTERTLDRVSAMSLSSPSRPSPSTIGLPIVPWYRQPLIAIAGWTAAALLAVATGYALGPRPAAPPEPDPVTDPLMAEKPRVIENLPHYLAAENLDYLLALDQSDLFADDGTGR